MCTPDKLKKECITELIPITEDFSNRQLIDPTSALVTSFIILVVLLGLIFVSAIVYCLTNDIFSIGSFGLGTVELGSIGLPMFLVISSTMFGIFQLIIFGLVGGNLLATVLGGTLGTAEVSTSALTQGLLPVPNFIPVASNQLVSPVVQSIRGLPGPPGPPGEPGSQGEAGIPAVAPLQIVGPQGLKGDIGSEGNQGYPGWPADPSSEEIDDDNEIGSSFLFHAGYKNPFVDEQFSPNPSWGTEPYMETVNLFNENEPMSIESVEMEEPMIEEPTDPWYTDW